ncbi:5'-nucleotidase YjjG [Bacillus subtilis]|uniref:5'-nucleotidase YjjG n=1 Tax=Bacillus subtilis TaxID=1423 RepID=A0AAP1H7N8_BACIU|nr:5'-nucleotidase YjjG [Bacillus subtilis]
MKRYRTLLFDVDDTILDFQAAEALALRLLFEDQNIPLTNDMKAQYKTINQGLWRAFEEGKMTRDEVVNTRFSALLKEYGYEADGALLEQKYRRFLEEGHQLIDGAFDLISNLQQQFDLYIVKTACLTHNISVSVIQDYFHSSRTFSFLKTQASKSR